MFLGKCSHFASSAHACVALPGTAASLVAAPSPLQPIGVGGVPGEDATLAFLECRRSPRTGKVGRPGPSLSR